VAPNSDGSLPAIGEKENGGWTEYNDEMVHAGFLKAYMEMHPQIMAFLEGKEHLPVICVGHSMGGGLATICARYLVETHGSPRWPKENGMVALFTFGSPRVGNQAFKDALERRVMESWRIVCEDDIVPSLPREDCGCWARFLCVCYKCNYKYATALSYVHVGNEVLFSTDGMLMINPSFAEERFMRNFRTRCWRPEKLMNHQMKQYRKCIKSWVARLHSDTDDIECKMLSEPPW